MKRRGFIGSLIGCIAIPFVKKDYTPPLYEMEITSSKITAGPRRLKCRWTCALAEDVKVMQGGIESDLSKSMMNDIQREFDKALISNIMKRNG